MKVFKNYATSLQLVIIYKTPVHATGMSILVGVVIH